MNKELITNYNTGGIISSGGRDLSNVK